MLGSHFRFVASDVANAQSDSEALWGANVRSYRIMQWMNRTGPVALALALGITIGLGGAVAGFAGDAPVAANGKLDCLASRTQQSHSAEQICRQELSWARENGDAQMAQRAMFQLAILARSHADDEQARYWHGEIQDQPGFSLDWRAQYRLAREQGILAYSLRDSASAMTFFRAALSLAETHDDPEFQAISLNDLGTAYRHIDAEKQALDAYSKSLAIKRRLNDSQIGTTLSNIADILAGLDELDQAELLYQEAIDRQRETESVLQLAHTLESMAKLAVKREEMPRALLLAEESYSDFERMGSATDQLRVGALLAQLYLNSGALESAADLLGQLERQSSQMGRGLPARWYQVSAQLLGNRGQASEAVALIDEAVAGSNAWSQSELLALLEVQARLAEDEGDLSSALAIQKQLRQLAEAYAQRTNDRDLANVRVLLEVAEAEHRIDQLEVDNELQRLAIRLQQSRTLAVALAGILGMAMIVAIAAWVQRRRNWDQERIRVRLQQRMDRYRQAVNALKMSSERLAGVLDSSDLAVIALGPDHCVIFANQATLQLLKVDKIPTGEHIDQLFDQPVSPALDAGSEQMLCRDRDGRSLELKPRLLSLEEEVQVIELHDPDQPIPVDGGLIPMINRHFDRVQSFGSLLQLPNGRQSVPTELQSRWSRIDQELKALTAQLQPIQNESRSVFREHLVELMTLSLDIWERETGTTRVDLAEKSGIWRVTIDEGRLRTRAMDRYLQISRLPKNPRWREVLRTAYFVLSECTGDHIETLDELADQVRKDASRLGLA